MRRLFKNSIIQLVLLTGLLCGVVVSNGKAAQIVKVMAFDNGTVGRLILDWGQKQPFNAVVEEGHLYIRFTKPFEADLETASRVLEKYVGPGEFLEGRQSIRFPVKNDFSLASRSNGTEITLDLTKAAATANSRKVKLRNGEHAAYSRLVFDWPAKPPSFSSRMEGDVFVLSFNALADINLNGINKNLPARVRSVSVSKTENSTVVNIALDTGMTVNDFPNDNSLVFDVRKGKPEKAAPRSAKKESPVEPKEVPKSVAKAEPVANPVEIPVTKVIDPEIKEPLPTKEAVIEPAPTPVQAVAEVKTASSVSIEEPIESPQALGEISPASGSAIAAIGPTIIIDPDPIPVKKKIVVPEKPVLQVVMPSPEKKVKPASNLAKMTVQIANLRDGFRLIFPWAKPAAMAMFKKDGNHWVVFDQQVSPDFSNLSGAYKFLVSQASQLASDKGTVLKFKFRDGYVPKVTKVNEDWHIDFQLDKKVVAENVIDIQSQPPTLSGERWFIPTVKNGEEIRYSEGKPDEKLSVIPLKVDGWGVAEARNYDTFSLPESMQGVAIVINSKKVEVASEQNGVAILVKPDAPIVALKEDEKQGTEPVELVKKTPTFKNSHFVKLAEWRQVKPVLFTVRKQELQLKVAKATEEEKLPVLMNLAKYYVGHEFYADAQGVLSEIKSRYPNIEKDRQYRLLMGLSELGLHHLKEAKRHLFHADFNRDVEVAPWRGVISAELDNWKQAARDLKYGAGAFGLYKPELQNRFNLLLAQAMIKEFNVNGAKKALKKVKVPATNAQKAHKALLEGQVALQLSNEPAASKSFAEAVALGYRPIAERARFELINGKLEADSITPQDAIAALEKLDFAWRGDELEVDIQKRLGDLYVATNDISNGLATYKRVVRNFPKSPYSRDLGRKMNDIFAQLFLEGGADELPPIKALALYYEYRELTPVGDKGDQMIRQLADRLAKVDLLEQSAQLLDHQVNFRLKGLDKANAGTRLAVIHLWNNQPQESLRVLYETRWRQLPPEAKKERLYIEARAKAGLKKYEDALSLIERDRSYDANVLRAEIFWKSKDWANVIPALEKLIGNNQSTKEQDFDRLDRQQIMQLAVARNLSDDISGLRQMRQQYGDILQGTPDQIAFNLITEETEPSASEFRERATVIAKVGQLESFMAGYREKLENGEFWATY